MKVDIIIPGVGESITEGTLASWSVPDGSAVIEGQALLEMETDKTTIDVTAPATGTLSILVPEGTDVFIDQVVGSIDTDAAAQQNPPSQSDDVDSNHGTEAPKTGSLDEAAQKVDSVPAAESPAADAAGRVSPAAKAAAAVTGLKVDGIEGSGRDGMVTKSDVIAAAAKRTAEAPPAAKSAAALPNPEAAAAAVNKKSGAQAQGETRKPLSRIRRVIAANLERTRDELVLLTTFNEADMSAIKTMRSQYGEAFKERHGVKLGFMSFFLKASATALEAFPEVNARIDGSDVVYPDGVHISVAVSTPKGLVTPVVRHVQNMGFADIEKEIISFSQKAADKTLLPDDLAGGSFTVTNGGIFGSMMSTPLPAPKQSAILGMHAINDRPVAVDGAIVIRPMMYLALSYDHRLVDGREAVGCLKTIKEALEHPERLLLEI